MNRHNVTVIKITGMVFFLCLGLFLHSSRSFATVYNVGPGQKYTTIGSVPWYKLQPGDTVYINYKSTPYYEKWLISGRGTPSKWIRVLGVPGPNGELPIISGNNAITSTNSHYRWQTPTGANAIQWDGVIQIAVNNNDAMPLPGYIEIANLQVQDGYKTYSFTAENGTSANYEGFAACIYARSAQHLLIRNNVLTNCGQGFYNWTGSGSKWWDGLQVDTVLRGNHFYNNGQSSSYTEHQTYTESDNVIIEYNRYGPMRSGALGSHLKDRSAGTTIRYNFMETAPSGWVFDLVEPEGAFDALGAKSTYKQAFIYGNILVNKGNYGPNYVHWNEDHQMNLGRTTLAGAKLLFYGNTLLTVANQSDMASFSVFNTTWGGYDCPPAGSVPGLIDARNNLFAVLPRTVGSAIPKMKFGYCSSQNFNFGNNWASPGWATGTSGTVTGTSNIVSPASNDPGFVNMGTIDLHLASGSSAIGIGGALASEVTSNYLGLNLTSTLQYVYHQQVTTRASSGIGSDVGAFSYSGTSTIRTPITPIIWDVTP